MRETELYYCMVFWDFIKEDWKYHIWDKLRHNRYRGANRLAYQLLCFLYYPYKTIILFLASVYGEICCLCIKIIYPIFVWLFSRIYSYFCALDIFNTGEKSKEKVEEKTMNKASCENRIRKLWYSDSEIDWHIALNHYDDLLRDDAKEIEYEMKIVNSEVIRNMSTEEFYEFLYNKYYVWKYTDKRRLSTTRKALRKYKEENRWGELSDIHKRLFSTDHSDVKECLKIAEETRGLGTAGASGLLSILFPKDFGTIDQFVVRSLQAINDPQNSKYLDEMNPDNLKINDGVVLINIMRKKAEELNEKFNTEFWTPRKIDMILWSFGRTKQ